MKRILTLVIFSIALLGVCACGDPAEGSGNPDGSTGHTHTYSDTFEFDADLHWLEPTCDDTTKIKDRAPHTFDGAECTSCDYKLADTEGLVFELNEDGNSYAMTSVGSVEDETIVVPAEYEGKPVTKIADRAFWNCTTVVKIVIQPGVKVIGEYAFADCINTTSITIPEGVEEIGYMAFMDMTSLPELTLPGSLKKVGGSLVFYSRELRKLSFNGTMEQWDAVEKEGWNYGVTVKTLYCTDGEIATGGGWQGH